MALKVESKVGKSNCLDTELFEFLSDFSRFVNILPPQHKANIQATKDTCTISAGVMGTIVLHHIEKESPKLIKIGTTGSKETITLWIQLKQVDAYDTRVKITVSIEASFMAKMMIKNKIQTFADSLTDGICQLQPYMLKSL